MPGLFDSTGFYLVLDKPIHEEFCCFAGLRRWWRSTTILMFPMWYAESEQLLSQCVEGNIYHMRARLRDGREAVLIDPGAVSNLAGDVWVRRVEILAKAHGLRLQLAPLDQNILIEGVGQGTQTCLQRCKVPVQTSAASTFNTFEAPVVPKSSIPGLLGLEELKARNCLLDCKNGILYEIHDNYSITAGKGSVKHQLEPAMSGHWMLPITQYN